MRKGDKQKYSKLIIFLLLAGIAIVVLNTRAENPEIVQARTVDQYSNMFFTYTTISYPAKTEVLTPSSPMENLTVGFNAGFEELDFSRVEVGSSVKKQLNLTTKDEKFSKITVKVRGNIKPLIKIDKSSFVLNGNDAVSVTMDSGNQLPGNYSGDVSVIIQRSNSDLLKQLLGY